MSPVTDNTSPSKFKLLSPCIVSESTNVAKLLLLAVPVKSTKV